MSVGITPWTHRLAVGGNAFAAVGLATGGVNLQLRGGNGDRARTVAPFLHMRMVGAGEVASFNHAHGVHGGRGIFNS